LLFNAFGAISRNFTRWASATRSTRSPSFGASFHFSSGSGPAASAVWAKSTCALSFLPSVTARRTGRRSPARTHSFARYPAAPKALNNKIPSLGPVTGERRVVATEGKGRLETIDGTKVLFLKGSPEEMGRQHGTLLKAEIHDVMSRILYGIGVGSSFEKGNWFFGEIEGTQARVEPFVDPRHLAEMDALASAAGLHVQETRLGNFFPELFHCSGFSLFGKATKDGRMYHGRVLDYMKGVGLEQNAVVIVHQPDYGHAWINLTYAGFVGSVTAMNAKGISIGEMGGGGYGHWDGKPMAHLMREVMEKSSTLDQAIEVMRVGPRTCEYYYVISDGNAKDAVGIAATPDTFEVIRAGQSHPRLRHAIEDAVLMSAGDRYEHLAQRVKDGYGSFTPESAIALMSRPVCMTSNIQSVLFAPDTLDLWVANADGKNVASATRFTKYNLRELLESEPQAPQEAAAAGE
jgi:isopenicillin-N N-acyltransferase-like protein